MRAMVAQLKSESEDLQQVNLISFSIYACTVCLANSSPIIFYDLFFQVIASVLRNLSWRADVNSKKTLREVGSVRALTECALEVQKVRAILGAAYTLHVVVCFALKHLI